MDPVDAQNGFVNAQNVMKQLKVPLTSNELVEIFNNFPRIKGDRIRMNDFINAINSKSPSSFFLQSDPSYLNDLESRLIKAQNRIKELSKHIILNNNEMAPAYRILNTAIMQALFRERLFSFAG